MTRRERLESRLEKRREWAESRERKADNAFHTAHAIGEHIPFGQPILVGHHSEKHARRDQERIFNAMSKGVECSHMAEHHKEKAAGIQHQLNTSIFSDDPDAIEALTAKVEALDAERERCKYINKEIRKGEGWAERIKPALTDKEKAELMSLAKCWGRAGFPSYHLTSLSANARTARERIQIIQKRQQRQQKAEESGGILITSTPSGYSSITFSEKPEREILNALKSAGFYWRNGSWSGNTDAIPESVRALCQ
jgi:hypothetical protein